MTAIDTGNPEPMFAYDGRVGDLYRIFLVNLLLSVLTLGLWRFWAITRLRRYLWSRTSSGGERFEYDGTGGQLFLSFVLALVLLIGLGVVAVLAGWALHFVAAPLAVLPFLAFEAMVVVFAFGAVFSAQRYRLSHTLWRGIRGGMRGSMLAYGLRSLVYTVLKALSLWQLGPWVSLRLLERRIAASFLGDQRFAASGRARALYPRFLLTMLGVVGLGLVVAYVGFLIERPFLRSLAHLPRDEITRRLGDHLPWRLAVAWLVFSYGAALISASYTAAFYRHLSSRTTLGGLRFACSATGDAVLGLLLGNALLLLVTLGFGLPLVVHRNARFYTANLLATGTLDLASLRQGEHAASRYGEGLFQALDAGAGFG